MHLLPRVLFPLVMPLCLLLLRPRALNHILFLHLVYGLYCYFFLRRLFLPRSFNSYSSVSS